MPKSPGLPSFRVGAWGCAARRHAERFALLLAHRQGIWAAAVGLSLYSVEARDLLREGSCGPGPHKISELNVARTFPDVAISGMGGRAARKTKLVSPHHFSLGKQLRPGHHARQNLSLGRENRQNQMISQWNVVIVMNLHHQKPAAIIFTQIQWDALNRVVRHRPQV